MTHGTAPGPEYSPPSRSESPRDAKAPHPLEANLSHDDSSQLDRIKAGDREALQSWLHAVRPRLRAVALKMTRNRDDAEDITQEALLKVWRYVGRFEGRAAVSTWLHRIVVNAALDRLCARRWEVSLSDGRRAPDDGECAGPARAEGTCADTPEDLLGRAEVGAAVRGAMATLSPVHRQVLALRELEGESYQAIARLARCPVGTVMSRLHHARHRLGDDLAARHADLVPRAA